MNLSAFIHQLLVDQQLYEISEPVNPFLELAALTDLVCKSRSNKALLFSGIPGSQVKIATNLFGTDQRMAAALGAANLADFGTHLHKTLIQGSCADSAGALKDLALQQPRVQQSPVTGWVENDLSFLPQIRFWPQERRTFLTLAVVITASADTQNQNYGLYRVGISGRSKLLLNFLPGSEGGQHLREWQSIQRPMPVAVVLGADPALIFAAAASLPPGCDESRYCAFLQRRPFAFSAAASVPLEIPHSAQIILEGWVSNSRVKNEGPFGCFRGNYGGGALCPTVEISAIRRTTEPLVPLTLAGPLPMEDCWLAKANHELMRARLLIDLPHLELLDLPLETAFSGLYYVRSHRSELSVADIAAQLKGCAYFRRLQMLIKLDPDAPSPNDFNWRQLAVNARADQVWRLPSADLDNLLKVKPPCLTYPPVLLQSCMQRLTAIQNS